jgi:hypothetical protein
MQTQNDMILRHLRAFGSISPREAFDLYGCMRLGARIYDLKRQGFAIRAGRETSRNRRGDKVTYARYYMEG